MRANSPDEQVGSGGTRRSLQPRREDRAAPWPFGPSGLAWSWCPYNRTPFSSLAGVPFCQVDLWVGKGGGGPVVAE